MTRPPLQRAMRRRVIAFVVAALCALGAVGNLTDLHYLLWSGCLPVRRSEATSSGELTPRPIFSREPQT